jgi:uncharacterized protein (TIGR02246 family)
MDARPIEEVLLDLERRYWQAIRDKDVAGAARLTDYPCTVAGASGIGSIDEPSFRKIMEGARYTLRDFEIKDDAKVRMLRDDVALLAYKVHEELIVDGKPVAMDAADASTWVRRDGRWLCALHTEAIAGDPFGRDKQVGLQPPQGSEEKEIRDLEATFADGVRAKDAKKILSAYAPDVVVFDARGPLHIEGLEAYRRVIEEWISSYIGPIGLELRDQKIAAGPETAFSHRLNRVSGKLRSGTEVDMWVRVTVCYRKIARRWLVTHEHVSVPFDSSNSKALLDLKP